MRPGSWGSYCSTLMTETFLRSRPKRSKADAAVSHGEQGIVRADAHIQARMDLVRPLANQDVASQHIPTVGALDAQAFAFESRPFFVEPTPFFYEP